MGLFGDLFGGGGDKGSSGKDKDYASPRNSAEREAARDYVSENVKTGKDPIPDKAPDWAPKGPKG